MKIKKFVLEELTEIDIPNIKLIAEDNSGYKFYLTLDKLIEILQNNKEKKK